MDKLFIVILKFIGIGLGFLIIVLINKQYGKVIYGVFTYYFSLVQIFSIVLLYGSEIKIFRTKFKRIIINETVIYIFVRFLILSIIFLFFNNYIFLFALIASLFLSLRIINSVILRLYRKFFIYSFIEFILLNLVFILLLLISKMFSILNILKIVLISHVFAMLIAFFMSLIFTNFYIFKNFTFINLKLFIFTFFNDFKIILPSFLWILEENIDIFMIKYFFSYTEVGVYGILMKFAFMIYLPVIILNNVFLSKINNKKFVSIRKISFILAMIIFIFLCLFNKFIFNYFHISYKFLPLFVLILLSFLLPSFFGISYNLAQLKMNDNLIIKIMMKSLLCHIIISLIFLKFFGIYSILLGKLSGMFLMSYLFYKGLKW